MRGQLSFIEKEPKHVLMSLREEYYDAMLEGRKHYEYRTRYLKEEQRHSGKDNKQIFPENKNWRCRFDYQSYCHNNHSSGQGLADSIVCGYRFSHQHNHLRHGA